MPTYLLKKEVLVNDDIWILGGFDAIMRIRREYKQ